MSKQIWNVNLGALLLFAGGSVALPTVASETVVAGVSETSFASQTAIDEIGQLVADSNLDAMSQVTGVSELQDVSPGDWAYEALQNLVERYGCIAGYPDSSYRGNRALTRYEFAAGLNACLQQIERIIAASTTEFVSREDLATLQRLQAEFEAELATLGTQVDNLEGRVAFVEENQFSTTTKLLGEVIFDLTFFSGDEKADGSGEEINDNVVFSDRVRLNLATSFTGEDLLFTRLQAGNFSRLRDEIGTDIVGRSFLATGDNDVTVHTLFYQFPVGDNIDIFLGTAGVGWTTLADTVNPYFKFGSLSFFTNRNPAVYNVPAGQGVGARIRFSDSIELDVGYLTRSADSPLPKEGLFNGAYSAAAQLTFETWDALTVGLTYVHTYEPAGEVFLSGGVGSALAADPFETEAAVSADRFGIQTSLRVTPGFYLGGWVGYVDAIAESGVREGNQAEIWNWFANATFPDFGKEGSVLGFGVGMPPKATSVEGGSEDEDTTYVLEGFYNYRLTDNISIIPGAYVILNPNHNADNDPIYVGRFRTIFRF